MTKQTPVQKFLRESVASVAKKGFTYIDLYKKARWTSRDWNAHWKGEPLFLSPDMESRMKNAVHELVKGK